MSKLIKDELKSNVYRLFKKDYSYKAIFKKAWEDNMFFLLSILMINFALICGSILFDSLIICLHVTYWLGVGLRSLLVILALINFQPWQNEFFKAVDIIIILVSIFIPIWSVFLLIYLVIRTYMQVMLMHIN